MKPIVNLVKFGQEEEPATTSLNVAEVFGKRHGDVLRAIKNMEFPDGDDFGRRNFALSSYINEQGKEQPMYVMTKDGFSLLVMGFTGSLAMKFKVAYIRQFNKMEQMLQRRETKRLAARQAGIAARRTMTDELRDSGEPERMHGHAYSTYTQLAYKTALGENLNQTRKRLNLSKGDSVRDHLDATELKRLDSTERVISGLLSFGLDYSQIKDTLTRSVPQVKH